MFVLKIPFPRYCLAPKAVTRVPRFSNDSRIPQMDEISVCRIFLLPLNVKFGDAACSMKLAEIGRGSSYSLHL